MQECARGGVWGRGVCVCQSCGLIAIYWVAQAVLLVVGPRSVVCTQCPYKQGSLSKSVLMKGAVLLKISLSSWMAMRSYHGVAKVVMVHDHAILVQQSLGASQECSRHFISIAENQLGISNTVL